MHKEQGPRREVVAVPCFQCERTLFREDKHRGRYSLLGGRVFGFIVRKHKTAHSEEDRKR